MTDHLDYSESPEPEGSNEYGYRQDEQEGQSVEVNSNPGQNDEANNLTDFETEDPRTSDATADANIVTTSTERDPRTHVTINNTSMASHRSRRSMVSQLSILSTAVSILTWILTQFHTFKKLCDGTINIPVDLLHIFKVLGMNTNYQAKKMIRNLSLTSVSDLLLVEKPEWTVACDEAGISVPRSKRLWKGVIVFKRYSQQQLNNSRTMLNFSPTSYTNVIHSVGLDNYFAENYERPSPESMFTHLNLGEDQEHISPINSNDHDNNDNRNDYGDVGDDFGNKNENENILRCSVC
jgi:hypothetical protein